MRLIRNGQLDMYALEGLDRRPDPFESGEDLFWDDPHIARGMLRAHLNPEMDAASRRPEFIDASMRWLAKTMDLRTGDRVLDLGCGPGLYCERLVRCGMRVTGIDISRNSIDFARKRAEDERLEIDYVVGDYHGLTFEDSYRAALLIYGQFAVDPPNKRRSLLAKIRHSLLPGAAVALDVPTRHHFPESGGEIRFSVHPDGGFWRPEGYCLLRRELDYPGESAFLNQHIVITSDGRARLYNIWSAYYTAEEISALLNEVGFTTMEVRGDLAGSVSRAGDEWVAVVASAPR